MSFLPIISIFIFCLFFWGSRPMLFLLILNPRLQFIIAQQACLGDPVVARAKPAPGYSSQLQHGLPPTAIPHLREGSSISLFTACPREFRVTLLHPHAEEDHRPVVSSSPTSLAPSCLQVANQTPKPTLHRSTRTASSRMR